LSRPHHCYYVEVPLRADVRCHERWAAL
jgi:hypothetical protein